MVPGAEAVDDEVFSEPGGVRVVGEGDRTAVWMWGEHDLATVGDLSTALVEAVTVAGRDVVVDLGDVEFMDASTLGSLVRGRHLLEGRGRRLTVRAPRRSPRRLLVISGLAELIESPPPDEMPPGGCAHSALKTWVEVPPRAA